MHPATAQLLRHFAHDHLPEPLAEVSKPFHRIAHDIAGALDGPEVTVCLRKLLEAKDCAVRAAVGTADAGPRSHVGGHGIVVNVHDQVHMHGEAARHAAVALIQRA